MKYKELLMSLLESDYKFHSFKKEIPRKNAILLRHDIDFDVGKAHEMAKIEYDIGVTSTYFFMLRSYSYNLLEKENIDKINNIKSLGHEISLHFDPVIYDNDFIGGLKLELSIFEKIFSCEPQCISFHRPTSYFLNMDTPINNINHTYQSTYTKRIKYISDSQGQFKYDHPLTCNEFKNRKTIHLLIHPIWWINKDNTLSKNPANTINNHLKNKLNSDKKSAALNCKPYKEYLDRVIG